MRGKKRLSCRISVWVGVFCRLLISPVLIHGQTASPHVPLGVVSDWTHHHVLYPDSKDDSVMARIQEIPAGCRIGISAIRRPGGRNTIAGPARLTSLAAETGACPWRPPLGSPVLSRCSTLHSPLVPTRDTATSTQPTLAMVNSSPPPAPSP